MKISKQELEKLYLGEKLSIREIALKFGVDKDTIAKRLARYNIPIRSISEGVRARYEREKKKKREETRIELEEIIKSLDSKELNVKYKYKFRENQLISLPLSFLKEPKEKHNVVLTLVISDLHLGDTDHLPDCYWSSINNLLGLLKIFDRQFRIKHLNVILNGDIVSGREVYSYQHLRNLLERGHWQVFLAEIILKETFKKIEEIKKIDNIYLIKGTHESLAENYILYLKRVIGNAKYLGHSGVLNIGYPIGNYNVFFTHGIGSSEYMPISRSQMRDLWKLNTQYKHEKIPIERYCIGHSHWLTTNLEIEGMTIDVTGGFQKWEKTVSQRPCGLILYVYCKDNVSAIPIRPDEKVELNEKAKVGLEYKNLLYYGKYLLKHLKEIEKIDVIE